jgi:hypothetical protein
MNAKSNKVLYNNDRSKNSHENITVKKNININNASESTDYINHEKETKTYQHSKDPTNVLLNEDP